MGTKRELVSAGFTITGSFITEHHRSLVAEGKWRRALESLQESLHCESDLPIELFYDILGGYSKIVGENAGMQNQDDDIGDDHDFQKKQYQRYTRDLIVHDNEIYQVFAKLKPFTPVQLKQAFKHEVLISYLEENLSIDEANQERADHWCDSPDDVAIFIPSRNEYYLAKPAAPDYPAWLTIAEFMDIINRFGYYSPLPERGQNDFERLNKAVQVASNELLDTVTDNAALSDEDLERKLDEHREAIRVQADNQGGWLTLTNKKTGTVHTVPKHPFMRWAHRGTYNESLFPWDNICSSGYKTLGDCADHTDFLLFTNIPLSEAHNDSHPEVRFFDNCRVKEQTKGVPNALTVISNGQILSDINSALVIHINSPEDMAHYTAHKNVVFVIPTASVDYEPLAYQCAKTGSVMISESGGKLCHFAKVGREMKLNMFMLADARKALPHKSLISIRARDLVCTLTDFSPSTVEQYYSLTQKH